MKQKLSALAVRRSDLFYLPFNLINIEKGWNARTTFNHIDELAASILANGIITPLKIRRDKDGTIYLVDGERRYRATAQLIESGKVSADFPVPVTVENSKEISDRLITQLESNTGMPFSLLEKARLYQRIRETGVTAPEIARRAQTSKQAVYTALLIIDSGSPHVIALIEENKISASFAADIIKAHPTDHPAQDATAQQALENAASNGKATASPKNIAKPTPSPTPTIDPSDQTDPSDSTPPTNKEPDTKDEDKEEDNEPTTIVVNDTARKDTVNPPPNPAAYEGLKNAESTHRDGSSASDGPSTFSEPHKQVEKLDKLLDKFHFEGKPDDEDKSTDRLNSIEVCMQYIRGEITHKILLNWINCKTP